MSDEADVSGRRQDPEHLGRSASPACDELPGMRLRRCLARLYSRKTMERVFDPVIADLQDEWPRGSGAQRSSSRFRAELALCYRIAAEILALCASAPCAWAHRLVAVGAGTPSATASTSPRAGISRYGIAFILAGPITLGLFLLMDSLIAIEAPELTSPRSSEPIEFVRIVREHEPLRTRPPLPEPELAEEQPPLPDWNPAGDRLGVKRGTGLGPISPEVELKPELTPLEGSHRDPVPQLRIAPPYPERAAARGIEGWVVVEFTITATGGVADPVVVDSFPSSIFNRSALKAIKRWKYNPMIVDGRPVSRPGIRSRILFELEEGR